MRIVAGEARGRKITAPSGRGVRPTTDRVREALFSHLGERVVGARVLDLFAGSGALGLEALSRGAKNACFVEHAEQALLVLRRNISSLEMSDRAMVMATHALTALRRLDKMKESFDLVFLDPPYESSLLQESIDAINLSSVLAPSALVIAEHPRNRIPVIPKSLQIITSKRYGDTALSVIAKETRDGPL
jgi:16S rRNA (guanine966-N2)-methyltransferase